MRKPNEILLYLTWSVCYIFHNTWRPLYVKWRSQFRINLNHVQSSNHICWNFLIELRDSFVYIFSNNSSYIENHISLEWKAMNVSNANLSANMDGNWYQGRNIWIVYGLNENPCETILVEFITPLTRWECEYVSHQILHCFMSKSDRYISWFKWLSDTNEKMMF